MKEYLVIYIEYEEQYDDNWAVIKKMPIIMNHIESANNIKEVYKRYEYSYKVLNIIELDGD